MGLVEELREAVGLDVFGIADARSYDEKAPSGHRTIEISRRLVQLCW